LISFSSGAKKRRVKKIVKFLGNKMDNQDYLEQVMQVNRMPVNKNAENILNTDSPS